MITYIALLRGINVSGKNLIKMVELKQLFSNEGFNNVTTYIQSGNVVFQSKKTEIQELEQTIQVAIEKQFGHTINVLVLTKSELEIVFNNNPFLIKNTDLDIKNLAVTLLNLEPDLGKISEIEALVDNDEEFTVVDKSVFLYLTYGFAKTKLTNNLFEKKLKSAATTRNWRTITKLVELSNQ